MPVIHFTNAFDALVHAQKYPVDHAGVVIQVDVPDAPTYFFVRAITKAAWPSDSVNFAAWIKEHNVVAWVVHDEPQAPFEVIPTPEALAAPLRDLGFDAITTRRKR